jgi:hypothetical protein
MLEDRPHKLGAKLLEILAAQHDTEDATERRILMGVVNHGKSQDHIAELIETAMLIAGNDSITQFDYEADEDLVNTGYRIKIGKATLEIVQLAQYSHSSGEHFARELVSAPIVI